jgi:hypothetical protein
MQVTSSIVWYLYLISLPFVSAFALTQAVTVPLLLGIVLLLLLPASIPIRMQWKTDIVIPILFLLPILASALVNIDRYTSNKFQNHFISYFVTYIFFYFVPKQYLRSISFVKTSIAFRVGWVISILYCFLEFYLANNTDINLANVVPRPEVQDYSPTAIEVIIRARSFAEESAHYALYLGIGAYLVAFSTGLSLFYGVIFITALFMTVSTSAWIAMTTSCIYFMFRSMSLAQFLRRISVFLAIMVTFFIVYGFQDSIFYELIVGKFQSDSGSDRLSRFEENLLVYSKASILQILFGLGPGFYSWIFDGQSEKSIVSFYMLTLFQTGVFGLFALFVLFFKFFYYAHKVSHALAAAVIFISICSISVSNYWFPWMWFLFAVIDVASENNASLKALKR